MKQKNITYLSLVAVFCTVIGIRVYALGSIPTGLYWDEIAMYVDVKAILATNEDMHGNPWYQLIYPSYGDYKLPVYIWFTAICAKLFGLSEMSIRLPSFLAGIVSILSSYFIAKELFRNEKYNTWIATLTSLVVSVSPWSFTFSRTGFEGHLAQAFLTVGFLYLLKSFKNYRYMILSIALAVIATYTYFSVRFVWPIIYVVTVLVLTSTYFSVSKKNILKNIIKFCFPLVIYFLLLTPLYKADLYSAMEQFRYSTSSLLVRDQQIIQSNVYVEIAGNTKIDRLLFHRHILFVRELLKNYSDHLNFSYIFFLGDSNHRHGTGMFGLFLPLLALFFFVGIYFLFINQARVLIIIFIWWLAALLPASIPETTPHALRSINAITPLALIIGYGLFKSLYLIKNTYKNKSSIAIAILFICLFTEYLLFSFHYFNVYPSISKNSWQTGFKELATQIYELRSEDQKVIITMNDNRLYLWLMAYGPYTGSEFRTWEAEVYSFTEFDMISFGNVYKIVDEIENPYLIVTTEDKIKEAQKLRPLTITVKQQFVLNDNTVVIAEVTK